MVWMMESRIINWMRCWLFRDWCCGAAHSCKRSQPLHLETGHPSTSHWPTWLVLNYLKKMMIMKMYYSDKGSKSTYSGKLTIGISLGRDHKTWERLQLWVAEPGTDINGMSLIIHLWSSQMQTSLLLCEWPCQTFHSSRVTLYITQLILKEGGGLK